MKFIRRFCLLLCAFGVFLNVTWSNVQHAQVNGHVSGQSKSKQIAFSKSGDEHQFNLVELEEDVELDEDGGFHQVLHWTFSTFQCTELTYHDRNAQKYVDHSKIQGWNQLPLFIQYQNFRL